MVGEECASVCVFRAFQEYSNFMTSVGCVVSVRGRAVDSVFRGCVMNPFRSLFFFVLIGTLGAHMLTMEGKTLIIKRDKWHLQKFFLSDTTEADKKKQTNNNTPENQIKT